MGDFLNRRSFRTLFPVDLIQILYPSILYRSLRVLLCSGIRARRLAGDFDVDAPARSEQYRLCGYEFMYIDTNRPFRSTLRTATMYYSSKIALD